jgi:hypothetical protein
VPAPRQKVILFCPVRQDAAVLAHALDAHRRMAERARAAGLAVELWYFDDNDNAESSRMLRVPGLRVLDLFGLPERTNYHDHQWDTATASRITEIKDAAIETFLITHADALLLLDADMIPHPDMLVHLMGLGLPIVSEICWSVWPSQRQPDQPWMPNVWDFHNYGFFSAAHITRLRDPGVYQVGGFGGCSLIRREAFEAGVRFARVPGLDFWGEDRHLCTRAAAAGFPLHVDTTFPIFHVYRPAQLDEMARWRETGSAPEYFREVWLTDDWVATVSQAMRPAVSRNIACCFPGEVFSRHVACFWSDLQAHLIRRGFNPIPMYGEMSNPHGVREMLRQQVLGSTVPIDLVLWLDDDQLLSAPQFDRLLSDLDALPEYSIVAAWTWCDTEKPVISAGVMAGADAVKCIPFAELLQAAGVIVTEWTGFPAVLMRACVLRDSGPVPFAPVLVPDSQWGHMGEDVGFCLNAAARCGARVYVEPRVFVPHLKLKALGLDGSAKSIEQAVAEAAAMLAGAVEVRFKDEVAA